MKQFWLFFAFYFTFLSMLPCTDKMDSVSFSHTLATTNDKHQDGRHDAEHCAPLCSCACCGTIVPVAAIYTYEFEMQIQVPIIKHQPFFAFHYGSAIAGDIWQPPQVG
jgi:hypothetical protein